MQHGVKNTGAPGERLRLADEDWQLWFQPGWPARDLRDLLMLRRAGDLPALRVLRARRLAADGEPAGDGAWGIWLIAEQGLSQQQQQRCREQGVIWLDSRALPAALADYCSGLPPTRLERVPAGRSTPAGWLAALAVAAGAALLLIAHGDREQRISEQNQRAAAVISSLSGANVAREPVEQLHAALVALGVPALIDDRVVLREPQGLTAQAEARLLDAALAPELRAQLADLPALRVYLEQQARRLGQKRLVMGTEHCAYAGERVIALPGNRAFVLRLQRIGPWDARLRWAGVERIESQQLHDCVALRLHGANAEHL